MNIIQETKFALQIARKHFDGILRAIGEDQGLPYFDTHILRVVKSTPQFAQPAAALHDVMEDPNIQGDAISWQQMENWVENGHISQATADAVDILTRKNGITYEGYIGTIILADGEHGKIARAVKLADLMDNLRTAPEGNLRSRYIKALSLVAQTMQAHKEA